MATGVQASDDVRTIVEALEALILEAGGPEFLFRPRGYAHLGLVVLDGVYSLRANYDTIVGPLLRRFCEYAGFDWSMRNNEDIPELDVNRLRAILENTPRDVLYEKLNRQVAPGTGQCKIDLCRAICNVLSEESIASVSEFREAITTNRQLRNHLRSIPGVGPALMRYLQNLSGVQVVKPDTMVMAWIQGVLGWAPPPELAAKMFETAVTQTRFVECGVDARTADHLVWRLQSGREISR